MTTTHRPATDLGYLLHKHPDKAQRFPIAAGTAHVFYPVATDEECTAALLLDIDPIALARGNDSGNTLGQYVNDRPYACGSMMAVALGTVYRSAMKGVSPKQDLADTAIPLRVHIPALPARGGTELLARIFEPLGWQVDGAAMPLDPAFPQWGDSPYIDARMAITGRLADALNHLYVLLPVLDDSKHYWVTEGEVDKLLRAGQGWLGAHPERELISRRYLRHQKRFVNAALTRLANADDAAEDDLDNALAEPRVADDPQHPVPLAVQRRSRVVELLTRLGAQRVLDLGCGGGALLRDLLKVPQFSEIVGVDVSARALEAAERGLERTPERARQRVTLRQSALTYVDAALVGYDAAVLMEVIEHVDETRLPALAHAVFGAAHPQAVIVTTPNAEYNVRFETLPAGQFRHSDHRFEWIRDEFDKWATKVADQYGYTVRYEPIGEPDPVLGPPTQAAVFEVRP